MSDSIDFLVKTRQKSGDEKFHENGSDLLFSLLDFWRWSSSDLVANAQRGIFAEFIVACDLDVAEGVRDMWGPYDLQTKNGVNVEVKSAAFIQSWVQKDYSKVNFGIGSTLALDTATGEFDTEKRRQSDVYVFALLKHKDKKTIDPTNVKQWEFYVLPTEVLNERVPDQKWIGLSRLLKLEPIRVAFGEIGNTIDKMFRGRRG